MMLDPMPRLECSLVAVEGELLEVIRDSVGTDFHYCAHVSIAAVKA
jgi:hypothetical protein